MCVDVRMMFAVVCDSGKNDISTKLKQVNSYSRVVMTSTININDMMDHHSTGDSVPGTSRGHAEMGR